MFFKKLHVYHTDCDSPFYNHTVKYYNVIMKTAVVDIGSNSVRLMIAENGVTLQKTVETTQLATGLQKTGRLQESYMQATLQALSSFRLQAEKEGAKRFFAFATEAVRSAENGKDFIRLANEQYGIEIDLLSPEREAEAGFTGAHTGGNIAVFDIGGASTELIIGNEKGITYKKSLPIGVVRLKDMFGEDRSAIEAYIDSALKGYGEVKGYDKVIGIGGTPSTVFAISKGMVHYDPAAVHGSKLERQMVLETYDRLAAVPMEERAFIKGLPLKKAAVMPAGALLVLKIMDFLKVSEITLSESDNQEGYLKLYAK